MMEAALVAIFAFVGIFLYSRRAKRKAHLLKQYEVCMDSFYESADTLLKADDTPETVVDMLEFMQRKATDRFAAISFLKILLLRGASFDGHQETDEIKQFRASHPELWSVFGRAAVSSLLAVTLKGGPVGTLMRRVVFFDVNEHQQDGASDLAAGFREAECHAQAA